MAASRKPRSTAGNPPSPPPAEPAPAEPAPAEPVEAPDKYTRCAGHVLTERGWVPEATGRKVG